MYNPIIKTRIIKNFFYMLMLVASIAIPTHAENNLKGSDKSIKFGAGYPILFSAEYEHKISKKNTLAFNYEKAKTDFLSFLSLDLINGFKTTKTDRFSFIFRSYPFGAMNGMFIGGGIFYETGELETSGLINPAEKGDIESTGIFFNVGGTTYPHPKLPMSINGKFGFRNGEYVLNESSASEDKDEFFAFFLTVSLSLGFFL